MIVDGHGLFQAFTGLFLTEIEESRCCISMLNGASIMGRFGSGFIGGQLLGR
jgi:hypothetical protein